MSDLLGRFVDVARESGRAGFVAGVASFWATFGVTSVAVHFGSSMTEGSLWQWTSYYLFNAHNVPVDGSALGTAGHYNLFHLPGGELYGPTILYYVLPAVALVLGGVAVRSVGSPNLGRAASAAAGATVTFGYLASVGLALVLFTRPGLEEPTNRVTLYVIGADPLLAVVLAGVAYPVAFGSIGGLLGNPSP